MARRSAKVLPPWSWCSVVVCGQERGWTGPLRSSSRSVVAAEACSLTAHRPTHRYLRDWTPRVARSDPRVRVRLVCVVRLSVDSITYLRSHFFFLSFFFCVQRSVAACAVTWTLSLRFLWDFGFSLCFYKRGRHTCLVSERQSLRARPLSCHSLSALSFVSCSSFFFYLPDTFCSPLSHPSVQCLSSSSFLLSSVPLSFASSVRLCEWLPETRAPGRQTVALSLSLCPLSLSLVSLSLRSSDWLARCCNARLSSPILFPTDSTLPSILSNPVAGQSAAEVNTHPAETA